MHEVYNPQRLALVLCGLVWAASAEAGVTNQRTGDVTATLGEAVTAALDGDVLVMTAGTYNESVVIGVDLEIVGEPGVVIEWDGTLVPGILSTFGSSLVLRNVELLSTKFAGVDSNGSDLVLDGCVFRTQSTSTAGAVRVNSASATITNSTFAATSATTDGGAISASNSTLVIEDCVFDGVSAGANGGAIAATSSDVTVRRSEFLSPSAGVGGALYLTSPTGLVVESSTFCDAQASTDADVMSVVGGSGTRSLANNVVDASGSGGFDVAIVATNGTWTFEQNAFLSTGSQEVIHFTSATATVVNNVFGDSAGFAISSLTSTTTISYNAFYGNVSGDVGNDTLDTGNVVDQLPDFTAYSNDADCTNDDLVPQPSSPLLDAGDPARLDPDGGRSDIGPFGGPLSDPFWHEDLDFDGYSKLTDCNDSAFIINPGETEVCNGLDDDCDFVTDPTGAGGSLPWFEDDDGDGFGNGNLLPIYECDQPSGYVLDYWDCNDTTAAVNPDADELCDAVDQNCDGSPVIGAVDMAFVYPDTDGDGYGADVVGHLACEPDTDEAKVAGDCNDTTDTINPGRSEICGNGVDEDCSGSEFDGPGAGTFWLDQDGDGFGDDNSPSFEACGLQFGWAATGGDCDDDNDLANPSVAETCNGVDDDCTGFADDGSTLTVFYPDADGDGYGREDWGTEHFCAPDPTGWTSDNGTDCDDTDGDIHPDADEICNGGVDDDCDGDTDANDADAVGLVEGYDDPDSDGHGWGDPQRLCSLGDLAPVGDDCFEFEASINPDAEEIPGNSTDEDCDGIAVDPPVVKGGEVPRSGCNCDVGASPSSLSGAGGVFLGLALVLSRRRRTANQD